MLCTTSYTVSYTHLSVGLAQLGAKGEWKTCPAPLLALLKDADPYIACEAAYAAAYLGESCV